MGESNYQPAIRRCREGEPVELLHETGNPYARDGRAVVVVSERGETIGYLPNDSWLKRAIFEEGKGVRAVIFSIGKGESRFLGVALGLHLTSGPIGVRTFSRA